MKYNLVQLLQESVLQYSDKEVFKCLNQSLSYTDLDDRSNRLASFLLQQGVQKGDRIGIYMDRCLETVSAVYGILKAGGAYVPLNPSQPHARTLSLLEDCGIKHLITVPKLKRRVLSLVEEARYLKAVIGIDPLPGLQSISWDTLLKQQPGIEHLPAIEGSDLACIIYTSGSTGLPKGIMHSHEGIYHLAGLEADLHDSHAGDRIAITAPLHFDQSLFGYFSGPMVGATTVIFPDSYIQMPRSLAQQAAKEKLTIWFSVPYILMQMLKFGELENLDCKTLRWVRFGGEVFPVPALRQLMQRWPHARFINSYGPCEIARCTYYILDVPPKTDDPIPLGDVWAKTEYKILDTNDREVGQGEVGEFVVTTATMMLGYWNNPDLTSRSLYIEEDQDGNQKVFYRTGDLVRLNDANEIMFLGRNDRQVKLRGFRIELDEIENFLMRQPNVEEAAVMHLEDAEEDQIIAAVRIKNGGEVNSEDLKQALKKDLPPYAVPEHVWVLEDFPRTGSGKIDRNSIVQQLQSDLHGS